MYRPRILLAILCLLPLGARGQYALEVIPLRHSTAEQVLPALRPFLEPGGTLGGQYSQLIVRASPANVAELRRILETLDRPRQRLRISVRFDDTASVEERAFGASGRIGNRGGQVEIRAQDERRSSEERVHQQVQVLEGSRAVILYGESRPQILRERIQTPAGVVGQQTYVVRETASGFQVVPRIAGSQVELEIAPQRERIGAAPGTVESQRAATSTRVPLGEWVEIGGAVAHATGGASGIASTSGVRSAEARRIWVRVDSVGN